MDISLFDYSLLKEYIAQTPANPRESAKLMHINRKTGQISNHHIYDLPYMFHPGNLVVINNTKVFKARLSASVHVDGNMSQIELFLIRPKGTYWIALVKPGYKAKPGRMITITPRFCGTVKEKQEDGSIIVNFGKPVDEVISLSNTYGSVPVPPYIKSIPDLPTYQTSYAKKTGSVAAPTAGFHLTADIRRQMKERGVELEEVTLHVGLGTFQPIRTDIIEDHIMHPEWVEISEQTAGAITKAKNEHRRVIAIGTTTVRTLEGVAAINNGIIKPYKGDVNLYITPGFAFHIVDAMLTNFHLPKSTLLVLVSAFGGIELIHKAYRQAIEQKYRFYSFGDGMMIDS